MGKKNEKAIWIADEYAPLDVEMNNALLDMLRAKPKKIKKKEKAKAWRKEWMAWAAEEKAKADAKLAELFMETPVVGPRELVENLHPIPQMGRGKTATIPLVQPTNKYFCVQETAPWDNGENVAEFEKMTDGGFHVAVANRHGEEFADINMTPEQFAAFKQWVMEN
jgi:hypothetical protein